MTRHTTHRHTTHRRKAHKTTKARKPRRTPHAHQVVRSHKVRKVHSHISAPKAANNPYKTITI